MRFGWMQSAIDLGRRPSQHAGLRGSAIAGEGAALFVGGVCPVLILAQRVQPRLLLIAEQVVNLCNGGWTV